MYEQGDTSTSYAGVSGNYVLTNWSHGRANITLSKTYYIEVTERGSFFKDDFNQEQPAICGYWRKK